MDISTVGPWAVRMLMLALGGWLTKAGYGDDQLWGGITDALAGPLVLAGTAFWSWRATKAQKAELPAGVVNGAAELVSGPALATAEHVQAVAEQTAAVASRVEATARAIADVRAMVAALTAKPTA